MSTTKSQHKFAVLFSGSTDAQYIADMQKVYNTLKDYYGYPEDNIKVFIGSHDSAWSGWTPSGYEVVTNIADFQHSYHSFVSRSTIDHDPEEQALDDLGVNDWNTMMLYVTGKIDDSGAAPVLVLREADPGNAGDSDVLLPMVFSGAPSPDLTKTITGMYNFPPQGGDPPPSSYLTKTSLHIIMQTDKAFSFKTDLYNGITSQCMSLTFATDSSTVNTDIATGSAFTGAWTDGLKLVQNGGGLYADEIDTLIGESIDNLLVSTRKACKYVHGDLNLFDEKIAIGLTNPDDMMIGKPTFWIKDGDEHTPPRGWWESPDIWITNDDYSAEDNDYYMYDNTSNVIHVRVHIEGTHPVRLIYIGGKVFVSGGGGPADPYLIGDLVPLSILKPGENGTKEFVDYDFDLGVTHRCIRAKAGLTDFTDEQNSMDEDTDWDPHQRQEEAQRNTDPSLLKSGGGADTDTGEAKVDEETPEEEAKPETDNPETDTDTKSTKYLRGAKEHVYMIKNSFRHTRDFRYKIDPVLFKREKEFRFNWCRIDPRYKGKYQKLTPVMKPYPHINFQLKPGEEAHIVNHIGIRKEARIKEPVNLFFEIEMGAERIRKFLFWRIKPAIRMRFRRFSGVTMRVFESSFSMKGIVITREKKPVAETVVIIKTLNNRQSASVLTDKRGQWAINDINPDVYKVYAIHHKKPSKEVYVHGMPVKKKKKDKLIEIIV